MSRYTTVLVYTCLNWKDFLLKTHGFECWRGWDRGSQGHALALYCRQWSSVKDIEACCGLHSSHLTMTQVGVHLREQGSFCNLEWIWEQWKMWKGIFAQKIVYLAIVGLSWDFKIKLMGMKTRDNIQFSDFTWTESFGFFFQRGKLNSFSSWGSLKIPSNGGFKLETTWSRDDRPNHKTTTTAHF